MSDAGDSRDPGAIYQEGSTDLRQEESDMASWLRTMGEKLEALLGENKDDREQRKVW